MALAPHRCPRCRFPAPGCLCPRIPRVETRVEVVFLRHSSERDRLSNTGHWGALALPGAAVVEHGAPEAPLDPPPLALPGTWLLYPSPHPPTPGLPPPRRLVVPDGTWPQVRRMVHRIPAIQRLPRLPLPGGPAAPGLRRPPRRGVGLGGMSTLEALALALRTLGEPAPADALEALLADGVELMNRLRGFP